MNMHFKLVALITLAVLAGCEGQPGAPAPAAIAQPKQPSPRPATAPPRAGAIAAQDRPPVGHPRDFFPSRTGAKWVYEVRVIGEKWPLRYEEVSWPIAQEKALTYATRGIIFNRRETPSDVDSKTYALEIKVKGRAEKQGQLRYPLGVELEIVKDDLGIFSEAKKCFWAITDSGRFTVNWVVTHDPNSPGAPQAGGFGHWGQDDGNAVRLFFFAEKPGIQIGINGSPDQLQFHGVESTLRDFEGKECLHFTRRVDAGKNGDEEREGRSDGRDWLNQGFSEEMWFARSIGLVRLEQLVDGNPTMVWTLRDYSPGGE